jgi:hypothetical protein
MLQVKRSKEKGSWWAHLQAIDVCNPDLFHPHDREKRQTKKLWMDWELA